MANGIYNSNSPIIPGNGADRFGDKLVGNQFTDGTSQFTLGNFSIYSNMTSKDSRDFSLGNFSSPVTLDTLQIEDIEQAKLYASNNLEVFIKFNRSKVTNFTLYGSLRERIKVAVQNVIKRFPAAILFERVRTWSDYNSGHTATNIIHDPTDNQTFLDVNLYTSYNPFSLDFTKVASIFTPNDVVELRNLALSYKKYSLYYNNSEYPLQYLKPTTGNTQTGSLTIAIQGNPFSGGNITTDSFYIKPSTIETEKSFNSLQDMEKFLVERTTTPKYTAQFQQPTETDSGKIVQSTTSITWPTTDFWNIRINGPLFEKYLNDLYDIGDTFDSYKTNLISRFLTTAALKEFDTFDEKVDKILKIYGRSFDEIKKYIDGLAYMTKVTYDGLDNIPDKLLKNFAQTLGWSTPSAIEEEGFLEAIFNRDSTTEYAGQVDTPTPAELDTELYRRLLVNTAYLFKSKGTRKGIEFMLRFIGAPEALIEFNEHVYVAGAPINMKQFNERMLVISGGTYTEEVPVRDSYFSELSGTFPPITITGFTYGYKTITKETKLGKAAYPIDDKGYPTIPHYGPDAYFQAGAGWFEETTEHRGKRIVDTQTSVFTGNTPVLKTKLNQFTYGQPYLDLYRHFPDTNLGFPIVRSADNKKSWVKKDSDGLRQYNLRNRGTYYYTNTDKLIVNVKNVELYLNIGQGLEWDVWNLSRRYNCPLGPTALGPPYPGLGGPDWTQIIVNASKLSFFEFAEKFWRILINVKNRQTIDDGHGGGYPTLLNIYLNYLESDKVCGVPSNKYTYEKMIAYVEKLGDYWIRLVEQFVPATTIWTTGIKYENSIFHRDKFVYKHEPLCDDTQCFGSFVTCCEPIFNDVLVEGINLCGGLSFTGATWQNQITLGGSEYLGDIYYSSTTIYDIPDTTDWLNNMVSILSGITQDITDPNHLLSYYLINNITDPNIPALTDPNCVIIQGPCGTGEPICPCPSGYTFSATSVDRTGTAHGICVGPTITGVTNYTEGCQLPPNSLYSTPTGDILYNYDDSFGLHGIQFDVTPTTVIDFTGGTLESAGFVFFNNNTTCVAIGFGACVTGTSCGILATVTLSAGTEPITNISNIVTANCTGGTFFGMTYIPSSATTITAHTITQPTTCIDYPKGNDAWNANNGVDPHYFKSEICLNIQKVQVVPLPNTTDIYAFYDTSSTPWEAADAAKLALDTWVTDITLNDGFTGNIYHLPLSDERWLRWSTIPLSGGTHLTPICCAWQDIAVLPPGTILSFTCSTTSNNAGTYTFPTNLSSDVLVVNFIDESGGRNTTQAYHGCRGGRNTTPSRIDQGACTQNPQQYYYGSPPGLELNPLYTGGGTYSATNDWSSHSIYPSTPTPIVQPTLAYTRDFTAFTEAHTIYNTFKGFVYPIIYSDNNENMMFPLHVYGAMYSGTVDPSILVENPTVTALGGTFTAVTIYNPYSALTATNTSTGYVGAGLNNFGWGAKLDLGVPCGTLGCAGGSAVPCTSPCWDTNAYGNPPYCPMLRAYRPCEQPALNPRNPCNASGGCPQPASPLGDPGFNCLGYGANGTYARNVCTDPGMFFSEGIFANDLLAFLQGDSTTSIVNCTICLPVCANANTDIGAWEKGRVYYYGDLVMWDGVIYEWTGKDGSWSSPPTYDDHWVISEVVKGGIPFLGGNNFTEGDDCSPYEQIIIPENPQPTGYTYTVNPVVFKDGIFNIGGQDCFESKYKPCEELIDPCACTIYWSDENHHNLYDLNTPVCCPEDSPLNAGQSFMLGTACTPPQSFPYNALCVEHSGCECPEGYTYDPMTEVCSTYATVTATTSPTTVVSGDISPAYAAYGGRFCTPGSYTTCWTNPAHFYSAIGIPFWGTGAGAPFENGRLNNIGVWGSPPINDAWVGFSTCITATTSGEYLVGLAGDNQIRFALDGVQLVENPWAGSTILPENFKYWWVWPIQLSAGEHSLVLQGKNNGSTPASFGCEITGPWPTGTFTVPSDFSVFTAQTGIDAYTARTIFRSIDVIGGTFNTETNLCPDGFEYDICRDTCVDSFPCTEDTVVTQQCWVPCDLEDVTIMTNDSEDACNPDSPTAPDDPIAVCGCQEMTTAEGGTVSLNVELDWYKIDESKVPFEVLNFKMDEETLQHQILWTTPMSDNAVWGAEARSHWYKAIINPCCLGDAFNIIFHLYEQAGGIITSTPNIAVYEMNINDATEIEFYMVESFSMETVRYFMHIPTMDDISINSALAAFLDVDNITLQLGGDDPSFTSPYSFYIQKLNDSTYLTDNGTGTNAAETTYTNADSLDRYWALNLTMGDVGSVSGAINWGEMSNILSSPGVFGPKNRTYNMEIQLSCGDKDCTYLQFMSNPVHDFNLTIPSEEQVPVTNPCPTNMAASRIEQNEIIPERIVDFAIEDTTGNNIEIDMAAHLLNNNSEITLNDYEIISSNIYIVPTDSPVTIQNPIGYNNPDIEGTTQGLTPKVFKDKYGDEITYLGKWLDNIALDNHKNTKVRFVSASDIENFGIDLRSKSIAGGTEKVGNKDKKYTNILDWAMRSVGPASGVFNKKSINYNSQGDFIGFTLTPQYKRQATNSQGTSGFAPFPPDKNNSIILTTQGVWGDFIAAETGTTVTAFTAIYSAYTNLSAYTRHSGIAYSPDQVYDIYMVGNHIRLNSELFYSDRISDTQIPAFNFIDNNRSYIPFVPNDALWTNCGPYNVTRKPSRYSYYKATKEMCVRARLTTAINITYSDETWWEYLQEYRKLLLTATGGKEKYMTGDAEYYRLLNASIINGHNTDLRPPAKYEGSVVNSRPSNEMGVYFPVEGLNPNSGIKELEVKVAIYKSSSGVTSAHTLLAEYIVGANKTDNPTADEVLTLPVNKTEAYKDSYNYDDLISNPRDTLLIDNTFIGNLDTGSVRLNEGDEIYGRVRITATSTPKWVGTSGHSATTMTVRIGTDTRDSEKPYSPYFLITEEACRASTPNTLSDPTDKDNTVTLYWEPQDITIQKTPLYNNGEIVQPTPSDSKGALYFLPNNDVSKDYKTVPITIGRISTLSYKDVVKDEYTVNNTTLTIGEGQTNRWAQRIEEGSCPNLKIQSQKIVSIDGFKVYVTLPISTTTKAPEIYSPKHAFLLNHVIRVKGTNRRFPFLTLLRPVATSTLNRIEYTPLSDEIIESLGSSKTPTVKIEDNTVENIDGRLIIGNEVVQSKSAQYNITTPTKTKGRLSYYECSKGVFIEVPDGDLTGAQAWCCARLQTPQYYPCKEKTKTDWIAQVGGDGSKYGNIVRGMKGTILGKSVNRNFAGGGRKSNGTSLTVL